MDDSRPKITVNFRRVVAPLPFARWLILAVLFGASTFAHIGSPNIFFEGEAGPYPVRVMIRPPRVVPGLAEISVRVKTNGVSKVTVLPARWDTGRKGAPPPDIAAPVKGETNLFSSQLWLMNAGAYSVFVNVEGPAGTGTAIIPVNSLALKRLAMPRWMSGLFLAFGLALFILLVALVGAAVREGSLPIGGAVDANRRKWGRHAAGIAILLASGALAVGNKWWTVVDNDFQRHSLYKTVVAQSSIENGSIVLRAPERPEGKADFTPLVPDHGKIMHLFLIEKQTGRAFAHLHPARDRDFRAPLPDLPAGAYQIYADVTHESGLTETWISNLTLPSSSNTNAAPLDKDDAFLIAEPTGNKIVFIDGSSLTWENRGPMRAGAETTLRFSARNADGSHAQLEPYLSMYAHAVIWRTDGQVFTHLHPLGTISMTAQLLFARRENGERLANRPLDIVCGAPPKEIAFPYAFPETGDYRIWVQVKINGVIQTAVFQANVS
jgi:hypothetical protein